MRIGVGLTLITIGAILTFAVRDAISGIDLAVIGIIFMLVGGVVVGLWWFWNSRWATARQTRVIEREVPVEHVVQREVPMDQDPALRPDEALPPEGPVPPPEGPIPPRPR
jgi:hypothetical protein